jgi:hypothetical protein
MTDGVNLLRFLKWKDYISSLTPHRSSGFDLKLDPPINRRIPIARNRFEKIRKIVLEY